MVIFRFYWENDKKSNGGVIGYGRLGKIFTKYCLSFGAKVCVYDPLLNLKIKNKNYKSIGKD